MIDAFGDEPQGATPLLDSDLLDLKPKWIANRDDLNLAESTNIATAAERYLSRKISTDTLLDDLFVRTLHKAMYGDVWKWAGKYRTRQLNIGIDSQGISVAVADLMANAKLWLAETNGEKVAPLACEVHHKLVQIHPFLNGNGRLCRFLADLIMISKDQPAFQWGSRDLAQSSGDRDIYINALKLADAGNPAPLLAFAQGNF